MGRSAGYTVVNDVSVRDSQIFAPTMTLGKSWDTHGPMGPWIVTPDEAGDLYTLELQTCLNEEQRQHSNTRHLIKLPSDCCGALHGVHAGTGRRHQHQHTERRRGGLRSPALSA